MLEFAKLSPVKIVLTRLDQVIAPAIDTASPVKASLIASEGISESVMLEPEQEEGSSAYGQTKYYSFSVPVQQGTSYTSLEIRRDEATPTSFPLQNSIFVLPGRTAVEGPKLNYTVAASTTGGQPSSPVEITISAPVRQQGTLAPKITTHQADARPGAVVAGYQLWEGSVDLGDAPVTGAVSVSAAAEVDGGAVHDVLYLSAGVAGW